LARPHATGTRGPRPGLAEYLIVLAVLTLAASTAVALFGDQIRAFFGARPPGPR